MKPRAPDPRSRIAVVKATVAEAHGLAPADLDTADRRHAVVQARQLAMLLARRLTGCSVVRLGHLFHRDHSTVCYGLRAAEARLRRDPALARQAADLGRTIAARFHAAPPPMPRRPRTLFDAARRRLGNRLAWHGTWLVDGFFANPQDVIYAAFPGLREIDAGRERRAP